jgi:hypothetical protein
MCADVLCTTHKNLELYIQALLGETLREIQRSAAVCSNAAKCGDVYCAIQKSVALYRRALLNSGRRVEHFREAQQYSATPKSVPMCSALYRKTLHYIDERFSIRCDATRISEKRLNKKGTLQCAQRCCALDIKTLSFIYTRCSMRGDFASTSEKRSSIQQRRKVQRCSLRYTEKRCAIYTSAAQCGATWRAIEKSAALYSNAAKIGDAHCAI